MNVINIGCGLSVAPDVINYDASPTLKLQRLPIIGLIAKQGLKPKFPDEAKFGDIVKGLPHADASIELIYSSHVLEHLSLDDFRKGLKESLRLLKPNGVFRGVLPDLEMAINNYLSSNENSACSHFMCNTSLGLQKKPKGILGFLRQWLGNSQHLWMWDYKGLSAELKLAGFVEIRRAYLGDNETSELQLLEDISRWDQCLGFECRKPEYSNI